MLVDLRPFMQRTPFILQVCFPTETWPHILSAHIIPQLNSNGRPDDPHLIRVHLKPVHMYPVFCIEYFAIMNYPSSQAFLLTAAVTSQPVLQGNASLARAYRLFRTMGLHHLLIGPARPPVMGIITRKVLLAHSALHDEAAEALKRDFSQAQGG